MLQKLDKLLSDGVQLLPEALRLPCLPRFPLLELLLQILHIDHSLVMTLHMIGQVQCSHVHAKDADAACHDLP